MVLYLQPFRIDGLIGTILKGCLVLYTQLSNSRRTSNQKYRAIFWEFSLILIFCCHYISSCILGQLLMICAEGDSLSIPVWRQSVCHWHTPLLTASLTPFHSPFLWKVLFSCWEDICLTVDLHKKICHAQMWFNDMKLNIDMSLGFHWSFFRAGTVYLSTVGDEIDTNPFIICPKFT